MNSETSVSDRSPTTKADGTQDPLGSLTRELHEALRALGALPELQRVVQEIPDARTRLSYVGEMTEKAAHKVLNLVDAAAPDCNQHAKKSHEFAELLERSTSAPDLSLEQARQLLSQCSAHVVGAAAFAKAQSDVLGEIMLAQDFQDLSGQVIKKVVDMITRTELQLVQMLLESPDETGSLSPAAGSQASLEGPQTPDKALAQDDVDDLLASLGF